MRDERRERGGEERKGKRIEERGKKKEERTEERGKEKGGGERG